MAKTSKSERLRAERDAVLGRGVRTLNEFFVAEAEGHTIRDVDGNAYVDLTGGIGVLTTGHRPKEVVAAMKAQLDEYGHVCAMVFNYEPYVELAKALRDLMPFPDGKSALFNSGSEAVENAVKTARAATKRPGVIAFHNSFHGRTLLCLTLTGKYHPYKVGYEPFVSHVYHAPFPYHYRCPPGHDEDACAGIALEAIDQILHTHAADRMAAVLVEPVQGEGGFVVPPRDFLPGLRKLCDEHGILLIDDEIQAGLGRTGRMLAIEHFGVVPDLVTTAKALGAGFPISAITGRAAVMDACVPGSIGGTYGGHPLGCVAAVVNLRLIREALPAAKKLGDRIGKRLQEMQEDHPLVGDARGLGCMRAIELVTDRKTKRPAKDETKAVQREAKERGVLLLTAGWHDNVIRLLPPITMPADAMEGALDVLDASIAAVEKRA